MFLFKANCTISVFLFPCRNQIITNGKKKAGLVFWNLWYLETQKMAPFHNFSKHLLCQRLWRVYFLNILCILGDTKLQCKEANADAELTFPSDTLPWLRHLGGKHRVRKCHVSLAVALFKRTQFTIWKYYCGSQGRQISAIFLLLLFLDAQVSLAPTHVRRKVGR